MADPVTKLHFAPNANLVNGTYAPGADGFNLADVGPSEVGLLPPGVKGLVWVGDTISGATASFQATINSLIGNPNVYGFYLADEPGPGNAANLKAESDYIHAHDPGAKTFLLLLNNSSDTSPQFSYNPANTDIDLFGLDPYPVQTQYNGANYGIIGASVAAAEAQGIPLANIVPVYQAFGGGGYASWIVPTASQEQAIISTWGQYVPTPAFDFAYSWGVQNNDTALVSDPALQQVFAVHNGATSGSSGSLAGKVQLTGATEGTALPATTTIATFTDTNKADAATGFTATIKWGDGTSSAGTISGSNGAFTVSAGHTYADEGSFALSATIKRTADNTTITPTGTVASAEADVLTPHAATITGTAGQALNNVTVATFTDTNTANAAGDFAAAIKWGDGTTSAGTVSGSKGTFTVTGSHTYAAAGTNAVAVTLTDDAPGTATATANSSATIGSASGGGVPKFSHIVVVMEENHSFNEIIGNTGAPYINGTLAAGGALLTNYFALTHPSEPNYFGIYAGSTFGVTDDNAHSEPDPTLATVLQAAGKSFAGYVESSGSDFNHNPWESFPEGFSVEQDFSAFPASNFASLPAVSFVIPGVNNDMHNGTIAQGDTWLQNNINAYAQWAKANNSLLAVVWDEDDGTQNNQVPAILYGAGITPGTYNTQYNHYDMLATIAAAEGLTGPRSAATAAPITGMFAAAPPPTLSGSVVLSSATENAALPSLTKIATFTDTNKADAATGFTATIRWGDGTSSAGTISGSNGAFTVSAGHTYADEGSFALSATIKRTADNTTITPTGTVASAEADVLTPHAATITGTAGQVLNNVTVATFTDTNTANAAGDFAAAIKWGDGTTSAGAVSGSKGTFTVTGSHTYAAAGTSAVAVTLTDDAPGTATATANSSATIGPASGTGGGLTINSPVAGPISYSVSDSPVTVTSSGSVTSTGFNVDGIDGPSSGISTINNFGTVTAAGSNGAGVYLQVGGGTVTNNGGALLSGDYGVFTDGPAVVINSGTISGRTKALLLGNSGPNRVVVNPTAVFNGLVDGRAAPSTLEFAGGTGSIAGLSGGSGTVSQNGTWSFANFQTLSVDTGGTWTLNGGKIASIVDNGTIAITGSLDVSTAIDPGSSGLFRLTQGATLEVAAAPGSHVRMAFLGSSKLVIDNPASFGSNAGSPSYAGPQLQDFGAGDTIDLRQFSAAGAATQYDPATGLLQVSNSAQQHASLEFQASSLGSGTFQVASDGSGGILITHG